MRHLNGRIAAVAIIITGQLAVLSAVLNGSHSSVAWVVGLQAAWFAVAVVVSLVPLSRGASEVDLQGRQRFLSAEPAGPSASGA